jgi:hypothetical protein
MRPLLRAETLFNLRDYGPHNDIRCSDDAARMHY